MGSGTINLGSLDTTPGARSPLAPPAGFSGNADDWWYLMRDRYRCDPGFRQQLAVATRGRNIALIPVAGPYAIEAKTLLRRISE